MLSGTGRPMMHWVRDLAQVARYTLAIGTGASFGGITLPAATIRPTPAVCSILKPTAAVCCWAKYLSGAGRAGDQRGGLPNHPTGAGYADALALGGFGGTTWMTGNVRAATAIIWCTTVARGMSSMSTKPARRNCPRAAA